MKSQNGIMISCRKVVELLEMKQLEEIGVLQNFKLKLHLILCSACRTYEKQSVLINDLLNRSREYKINVKSNPSDLKILKEKIMSNL